MGEQRYAIVVTASGEVRDQEGNLISVEPIEARLELTADELAARGLTPGDSQ